VQVAAASTSNMLPHCKKKAVQQVEKFFFAVSVGVELGNMTFILLNPALYAYLNSIEIHYLKA
jgi:hypothetical protein